MKHVVTVSNLQKTFGTTTPVPVLRAVHMNVAPGEFIAIMGPSGSGKTTLLSMLAGLDKPTAGSITIQGQQLSKLSSEALADFRRTQLGYVFQDYNLLDSLTIGENIALPLLLNKQPAANAVQHIMRTLGIEQLESRFPYQVSGGQQQRAAVARALAHRPALLLADEPSGNLDSTAATKLLETFRMLHKTLHVTIIMVTHDPRAASYASRVIFFKDGAVHNELMAAADQKTYHSQILAGLGKLEGEGSYATI